MEDVSKLTIRLNRRLIEDAKRYATQHQTTVTQLVTAYLRYLTSHTQTSDDFPILRRLSGILPADVSTDAYQDYLVEKYGHNESDFAGGPVPVVYPANFPVLA